jgi:hypothetical protein
MDIISRDFWLLAIGAAFGFVLNLIVQTVRNGIKMRRLRKNRGEILLEKLDRIHTTPTSEGFWFSNPRRKNSPIELPNDNEDINILFRNSFIPAYTAGVVVAILGLIIVNLIFQTIHLFP